MKNLKTLAAEFNLYSFEDIPAIYKNQYFDHRIEIGFQKIPEFLITCKDYEVGLFWQGQHDTNIKGEITAHYIEHSYILVKRKDSENIMLLRQDWRSKKYRFHLAYCQDRKFAGINYHIKEKALKDLNEPNMIGVFSEKKLNDWAKYVDDYVNTLDNLLADINDENGKIEKQISDFIASLPVKKVSEYHNKTWVTTPLFEVIFEHFKDQKYLSTKISFNGTLADITKISNQ
jgi:hypothetical protein